MLQRLAILALLLTVSACATTQHAALAPMAGDAAPERSGNGSQGAAGELLDIRARLQLEVESVPTGSAKLRQLVQDANGQVVGDETASRGGATSSSFDIRVPAAKSAAFLDSVAELGHVLNRNVTATDVSKEFHDSEILLRNLNATMQRYEELLSKATEVKDMLAIEGELSRVRGQIEKVKGERRWLEDRVARATIHVDLLSVRPRPAYEPTAKFYPGLKASYLIVPGTKQPSYLGTGLSLQFTGQFSVDLDLFKWRESRETLLDGPDLLLLTFGAHAYSDFLGGGKRRFLNPYLGFRLGYARTAGSVAVTETDSWGNSHTTYKPGTDSSFALAGTVGLELVRVKGFVLDLQEQGVGLIGNDFGPSFGFQTSLTARVVF